MLVIVTMAVYFVMRAPGVAPVPGNAGPDVAVKEVADELRLAMQHYENAITKLEALAPGSDLEAMLAWTAKFEEQEVAWVGHMPDVGALTSHLIGAATNRIGFSKGAVAAIDFDGKPEAGRGILCWLLTAKMLGC